MLDTDGTGHSDEQPDKRVLVRSARKAGEHELRTALAYVTCFCESKVSAEQINQGTKDGHIMAQTHVPRRHRHRP